MGLFSSQKTFWKAARTGDAAEITYCFTYQVGGNFSKDAADSDGKTALALAAENGHLPIVNELLAQKCALDTAANDGKTALQLAIINGHTEIALTLIKAGANVNAHDNNYAYPLHNAAARGNLDVVKALIDKEALRNSQIFYNGRTPLHYAVDSEYAPVIQLLLEAGAKPDIAAKDGITAYDLAKTKALPHLLKIMDAAIAATAPAAAIAAPAQATTASISAPANQNLPAAADEWKSVGPQRLSHTGTYPELSRRITEIFNFETRERTVIAENLKTGAETLTGPESFDLVSEDALKKALREFRAAGGQAEESTVLGPRPPRRDFNL